MHSAAAKTQPLQEGDVCKKSADANYPCKELVRHEGPPLSCAVCFALRVLRSSSVCAALAIRHVLSAIRRSQSEVGQMHLSGGLFMDFFGVGERDGLVVVVVRGLFTLS